MIPLTYATDAPVYPYVTPYPSVRLPSVSLGPTLLSKPPSLSVSLPQPAALYPEFNLCMLFLLVYLLLPHHINTQIHHSIPPLKYVSKSI